MQAIVETLFDTCYLIGVVVLGIIMIVKSQGKKQYRLFGIMAVVLGLGDAFHLIPRAVALCTTGLENYTFALGTGKFITSITMTVFYIILYYIWRIRICACRIENRVMSLPPKCMDQLGFTFILGHLQKYSLYRYGNPDYRALLQKLPGTQRYSI